MSTSMNLFENLVDVNLFNKHLIKYGGTTRIKSNVSKITIRHFIFKLIKSFRKDFMKKTKRGGMADLYNDSDISYSTNIRDLTFSSYTHPPYTFSERDIY
jgi:hypothetical protein